MKQFIVPAFFVLSAYAANAQTISMTFRPKTDMLLCIPNSLDIPYKEPVTLSTNNGRIVEDKSGGEGRYFYAPAFAGKAMIYIKKKAADSSEMVIDSTEYNVERLPLSEASFAGETGGELSQAIILVQYGLIMPVECCGFDARFDIAGYTVLVHRNGKEVFKRKIQDAVLDRDTKDFFYTLKNGDVLKFENIKVKDCDGVLRTATPIKFTVKDAYRYYKQKGDNTVRYVEDPTTGSLVETKATDSGWVKGEKY